MGLRLKILSGFLILAFMLLIAGIWSIYELKTTGSSVQKLLDENYKSINAAAMMIEALEREDNAVLLLILGKWEEGRLIIVSGDSLFEQGFQVAKNNLTIPGEKGCVDSIQINYDKYKNLWQMPIVGTIKQGDLNWYLQTIHQSFLEVKSEVSRLSNLNADVMFATASEVQNKANRAMMPGIVAITAALVFSLLFSYLVNHYMVSPIVRITDRIRKFIDNKLPFEANIESNDELADLEDSIKTLCILTKTP